MPFLPPNQQRQSTEGTFIVRNLGKIAELATNATQSQKHMAVFSSDSVK